MRRIISRAQVRSGARAHRPALPRLAALALVVLLVGALPASAPPVPPFVDVAARPPSVVTVETSNSARASVLVRELLGERFDIAHLPPRTPIRIWRDRGAVVGFAVDVDADGFDDDDVNDDDDDDFVALRARYGDFAACHALADDGADVAVDGDGDCVAFADQDGASLMGAVLASPVDAWVVSSRVGERIHPITKRRRFHAGTDYAAPIGTPVVSIADGVVTASQRSWGAGRYVVVRHADGSESKYFHLDERAVERGARVQQGDLVGVVGKTGRVTGPHLHFELRDARGVPIDMAAARWPGSVGVDDDGRADLAARLRWLRAPPTRGWPSTITATPPGRHSDVDVGAVLTRALQWLVHHG